MKNTFKNSLYKHVQKTRLVIIIVLLTNAVT